MKTVFTYGLLCGLACIFPFVEVARAEMKTSALDAIDQEILAAIGEGNIPGAVLWLESKGEVYHKAYGMRVTSPGEEVMTKDTIFDLASLTKVMATAPSILYLAERGRLSLSAPVSEYIPEFLEGGIRAEPKDDKVTEEDREKITVLHLLTHQSGLPPGIFLSERDFWGHDEGAKRAAMSGLIERPGTRFRYSDVNYILLGEIVRRVSGQRIDSFVEDKFYGPLGMIETTYRPAAFRHARIAPTTEIPGYGLIRGQVHDPTCRRMEGVAGHAGVFSTAKDVAAFTRFFLNKGLHEGIPILAPATVREATTNQLSPALTHKRGLGWDLISPFSYQRGTKFPLSGFGHTGWTGTSIWVDPVSDTFVVLLANRNHPTEKGSIKQLRIRVGTLAAEAVGYSKEVPAPQSSTSYQESSSDYVASAGDPAAGHPAAGDPREVLNGIDVLEKNGFAILQGMKVGLITNQTGINRNRRSTIDLLAHAPGVELKALFSPEHGIRGVLEQDSVDDDIDAATGLKIFSLYKSANRKPSAAQMKGLDALVFDIQDIGCRFYTYISTMGLAMEAAADAGLKFVVLDRVNPIGGMVVDGPVRAGKGNDFVAFHTTPVQHGMTSGELAQMFNVERKVGADLTVVKVEGWHPSQRFDETGLPWVNPSPNIRSLTEAMLYPGVGLIEFTNVSVGRGTRTPFEHVGAPWIHDGRLSGLLQLSGLDGLGFLPTRFTPDASVYEGEDCAGVRFLITDRESVRPVELGIALMIHLYEHHPETFTLQKQGNVLLRHEKTLKAVMKGKSIEAIRKGWEPELSEFLKRRESFLLYPRN